MSSRTTRSVSRRRPDPPERRTGCQPAPDPGPRCLAAGRHGETIAAWPWRWATGRDRAHCCCHGRTCPTCPRRARHHQPGCLRAGRAGRGRSRRRHRRSSSPPAARCSWRCTHNSCSRRTASRCGCLDASTTCSIARAWPTRPGAAAQAAAHRGRGRVTDGWWKYGCAAVVGIDTYGESAPAGALFKHFGLTAHNVADTVRTVLAR